MLQNERKRCGVLFSCLHRALIVNQSSYLRFHRRKYENKKKRFIRSRRKKGERIFDEFFRGEGVDNDALLRYNNVGTKKKKGWRWKEKTNFARATVVGTYVGSTSILRTYNRRIRKRGNERRREKRKERSKDGYFLMLSPRSKRLLLVREKERERADREFPFVN